MIHAAGMVDLAPHIRFSSTFATVAIAALEAGAPILCDARMVSEGITRARLPAANPILCTLGDPQVPGLARSMANTRSAAALELWRPHLAGAVVAIGNAPTALFHLLNMLEDPGCPRPAAIIGCPVGFVGAAESKEALWQAQRAAAVRGWCPTAWQPMMAGDGLLVRVRPPLGRMDREQVERLCEACLRFGNGHIDLTNRAALQIRGVREADHDALMARLVEARLAQADPEQERRSPLVVTPDWAAGDDTATIAAALTARIEELPPLPAKIGFAIDAGPAPALRDVPADFRIERGASGGLILRAEGRERGQPIHASEAVDALIGLAHWFVASGGTQAGRMARHLEPLAAAATEGSAPARSRRITLARAPGPFYAAPFGRIEAAALLGAMDGGTRAVRLTPWRGLILEGSEIAGDDPDDARLAADACPGAPGCPQASVSTRDLAIRLAPHISGLHVSGCAKGCARPSQAAVVLTGRDGRFDLSRNARAGAPPERAGLLPDQIIALLGAL
jgi:precorrin-3B synthase